MGETLAERAACAHPPHVAQVSGDAFLQCLKAALDAAPNMHQALQASRRLLGGVKRLPPDRRCCS